MRKLLIITALILFAGISFGQTSKNASVDIEAEKAALNEIMDNLDSAAKDGDPKALMSIVIGSNLIR